MTKLILWCAYNLTRYLSCSIFLKRLAPWTTNMCLDRLFFLEVLATVVALFWQTGKGGEWQVIWCLRRPQIIHDVGSLCISTMWLVNLLHHQAVLHYTLPSLPLHLLLIIIILLLLLFILLLPLLFKEVWKASRPFLLSCRDL